MKGIWKANINELKNDGMEERFKTVLIPYIPINIVFMIIAKIQTSSASQVMFWHFVLNLVLEITLNHTQTFGQSKIKPYIVLMSLLFLT